MIGLTPLRMKDITTGEHTVMIRKAGYQDWVANVSVLGGSLGSVEAVLVSTPAPEPVVTADVTEPVKQ